MVCPFLGLFLLLAELGQDLAALILLCLRFRQPSSPGPGPFLAVGLSHREVLMPTQPQFPAMAPQQQHHRKELGWGPAVLGARSSLMQGQSALACESWDQCHRFGPTGASWSLRAAWAGLLPQVPIHTGWERDGER